MLGEDRRCVLFILYRRLENEFTHDRYMTAMKEKQVRHYSLQPIPFSLHLLRWEVRVRKPNHSTDVFSINWTQDSRHAEGVG
jgi:hypothetical protein